MADRQLTLDIVTPERRVWSEPADMVVIPGSEGYFGVLPQHAPMVSGMDIGIIKVLDGGKEIKFATSGGFVEINNNRVVVLAETAERGDDIDVMRARAAKERAEKRLANRSADLDLARAELALRRAVNRLKAAGQL